MFEVSFELIQPFCLELQRKKIEQKELRSLYGESFGKFILIHNKFTNLKKN